MRRVAARDSAAFRQLSDLYLGAIVTYSTRLLQSRADAEEVAQETFLRAWQRADTYVPRARVSTWLHRIAHNLALDRLRGRRGRGAPLELDPERDSAPASDQPAALLLEKERSLRLEEALATLPERQRAAVVLCHEQGLSNPEIGAVLDVGVEAVESLLSRGRSSLRRLLAGPGEPAPNDPQPTGQGPKP
jgi:RNA polymerase sigma-70 factor (ECF subfamily)